MDRVVWKQIKEGSEHVDTAFLDKQLNYVLHCEFLGIGNGKKKKNIIDNAELVKNKDKNSDVKKNKIKSWSKLLGSVTVRPCHIMQLDCLWKIICLVGRLLVTWLSFALSQQWDTFHPLKLLKLHAVMLDTSQPYLFLQCFQLHATDFDILEAEWL